MDKSEKKREVFPCRPRLAWGVQREVKNFSASCACVGECNEVQFRGTDAAHRDTEKGVQRSPVQGDWISVRYLAQIPLSSLYNTFNIGDTMRWYEGAPAPPSLSLMPKAQLGNQTALQGMGPVDDGMRAFIFAAGPTLWDPVL